MTAEEEARQVPSQEAEPAPPPPPEEDEFLEEPEDDTVMAVLAGAMPWVISLLLHVGIGLILLFVYIVAGSTKKAEEIVVPDEAFSETPGGRMNPGSVTKKVTTEKKTVQKKQFNRQNTSLSTNVSKTTKPVNIISSGGGGAAGGLESSAQGSGYGDGPKSNLFGSGGTGYNVVYVIDCSGSMVDTFDFVRREMLLSIGRLSTKQVFHIILFREGEPREFGAKTLARATIPNRKAAAKFLDETIPEGSTDPVPAVRAAFRVLKGASLKGKMVFLLTDGVFPDNQKVLDVIRNENRDGSVRINTYLYGDRPAEAVEVMEKIAEENGGKYKYVEHDY